MLFPVTFNTSALRVALKQGCKGQLNAPDVSVTDPVVVMDGTPEPLVFNNELLAVVISEIVFVALLKRSWFAVVVVGYVAVVATQLVPFALRMVPVLVAVPGNVAVVGTQFVPSACRNVPVPVATLGYVAVENAGSEAVTPCSIFPVVATPKDVIPLDAAPTSSAWSVTVTPVNVPVPS